MELGAELAGLQRSAFNYFVQLAHPATGLVRDTSSQSAPASVAVTGMGLSALCVGVERGWISRAEAAQRVLTALRFFDAAAPGRDGFFFHFLDSATGVRAWKCEVSTIDTGLFLLGALCAGAYFDGGGAGEGQIRDLSSRLFRRCNWKAFADPEERIKLAWRPESGFAAQAWAGYNEALLILILAMGAPEHALAPRAYAEWCRGYALKRTYGCSWLYCGPLFTHLFPHIWLDLRGRPDARMREFGLDYWESSLGAIRVQREYARRNPRDFAGYGQAAWGLSACNGPGSSTKRRDAGGHYGYRARGAPFGPDDGTLSPPVAVASFAFEPEFALESLAHWRAAYPDLFGEIGLRGAVNPGLNWICSPFFGLDQGMLCLLLENARSGLIWQIMKRCEPLQLGMNRAGFAAK